MEARGRELGEGNQEDVQKVQTSIRKRNKDQESNILDGQLTLLYDMHGTCSESRS